ncbi:MAG TPA: helix-turn-helix domain-containing protein [Pyrinomonadaceae bacterium]|jgi:tetratricopeptide (TPR) repeat protein|nr:helix-turn-helix domain-containing protein [Pyrinomonadaceae bacterium]
MELHATAFRNSTGIPVADNIIPLCELAKNLAEAGEFENACETLHPFWKGVLHRPETNGFAEDAKAELLLRAGTLTGWLGSAKQIAGAQEAAKDLISESASIFEALGNTEKIAEARVDLAICYWREGALDEARVTLRLVLETLGAVQSEQKLRALLNSAIVEKVATRDHDALRIYREAAPQFFDCPNLALKGKFHNAYANLLRSLGSSEKRDDYIDLALVEYAAASFHFEQVGFHSLQAIVENNVAFLFATIGKFSEAREHVDSARRLFQLKDHGGSAYTDDTLAQILLMEGNSAEAERVARRAVQTLKQGGEQGFLAEALITQGKALARLNQTKVAKSTLDQAVEISQTAGNPDRGGIAAITAIEELDLPVDALQDYYRTAETLLSNSQNQSLRTRLGDCARRVLSVALSDPSASSSDKVPPLQPGFSLDSEVLRYEGNLIRRALEESGGSVTRAARLLGVTHQGLAFILNGRHSDLLSIRTPVKRRRRSIIRHH